MKPLETVYWLRLGLGIAAALICAGLMRAIAVPFTTDWQPSIFFNSISLAILTYLGSYFVIKRRFLTRVEKTTKLFTTGIGIYFISWIVFWVLIYTALAV
jgi:glucan phosphoethanolaminetransferase (alkaline phosphatase superfamily)